MPRDHASADRRSSGSSRRKAARALIALSAAAFAVLVVSDLAVTHARAPSTTAGTTMRAVNQPL